MKDDVRDLSKTSSRAYSQAQTKEKEEEKKEKVKGLRVFNDVEVRAGSFSD